MAVRMLRYDRWGGCLGELKDVLKAEWTESLDGTDTCEIETLSELAKGDRVLFRDDLGEWHEHVVYLVERDHADIGGFRVLTENSICELRGDYILDKRPENVSAYSALSTVLSGSASERSGSTRWSVGEVADLGLNSTTFYRISVRECIDDILSVWGGELSTTIAVSGTEITSRKVNITRRGSDTGRRYEYGHSAADVKRTYIDADVVTALYAFGKGEAVGEGYGRRIDFAEEPSQTRESGVSFVHGDMFVRNESARLVWGRPDGAGGKAHVFGKVELDDIEDTAELLEAALDELEVLSTPAVSYEADVLDFLRDGYDFSGSRVGDSIRIVDATEGFELRASGRVTRTVRDLLDGSALTKLTIGSVVEGITSMSDDYDQRMRELEERRAEWDAGVVDSKYLDYVRQKFNEEFEQGGVYKYESFEAGTIYSSVPLDEHLKPTTLPAKAIQLKGGGFRISNSVDEQGNFVWTTAADGDGIIADVVTAGVIRGGRSYWDLSSGDLMLVDGTIHTYQKDSPTDPTPGFYLGPTGTLGLGTITASGGKGMYWDGTNFKLRANTVYIGNEQAATEQDVEDLAESITLDVSGGSLGNTAQIKLSVDGETQQKALDLSNVRSAWAGDTSSVTVTGGVIRFNGGTLVITSGNLTLDAQGNATFSGRLSAPNGTIGGFTIGSSALYNNRQYLSVDAAGVYVGTDGVCVADSSSYHTFAKLAAGMLSWGHGTSRCGSLSYSPNRTTTLLSDTDLTIEVTRLGIGDTNAGSAYRCESVTVKYVKDVDYVGGSIEVTYGYLTFKHGMLVGH